MRQASGPDLGTFWQEWSLTPQHARQDLLLLALGLDHLFSAGSDLDSCSRSASSRPCDSRLWFPKTDDLDSCDAPTCLRVCLHGFGKTPGSNIQNRTSSSGNAREVEGVHAACGIGTAHHDKHAVEFTAKFFLLPRADRFGRRLRRRSLLLDELHHAVACFHQHGVAGQHFAVQHFQRQRVLDERLNGAA